MSQDKVEKFLKSVKTELLMSSLKKHGQDATKRKDALEKLQPILVKSSQFMSYLDFYERIGKKRANKTKFLNLIKKLSSAPATNGIEEVKNWKDRLMICYISGLDPKDVEAIFSECMVVDRKKKFVYLLGPEGIEPKTEISLTGFLKEYNESSPLKMIASIKPSDTSGILNTIIKIEKESAKKTFRRFKDRRNIDSIINYGKESIDPIEMYPLTKKQFRLKLYEGAWHLESSSDLESPSEKNNEYKEILKSILKVIFNKNISLREEVSPRVNKFERKVKGKKSIRSIKTYIASIKTKTLRKIEKSPLDDPTKAKYKILVDTFKPETAKCKDDEIKLRELVVDGDINELDSRGDSSLKKVNELIRSGGNVNVGYSINGKKVEFSSGKIRAGKLTSDEEEVLKLLLSV